MEGYLTIPPDRGSILGRAVWKTRYVVIGSAQGEVSGPKAPSAGSLDGLTYLSIYKNPDDWEPAQQYAVSNVTHCQVQSIVHRKQGPALPTLILTIAPDPLTEKIRKRRSSRAATLVSNKDNGPTTLWFRTEGDASRLNEWARCIQSAIQPSLPEHHLPMSPMTPMTPLSPYFQNPFSPFAYRDTPESSGFRPPSAPKVLLHHKPSASLHVSRERPLTISDAPSLRSRRSDLSSLISSTTAGTATTHSYTAKPSSEVPSPIEMTGESFGGFIEGWTSAQGRSTNLNSPVRIARNSDELQQPMSPAALLDSGSPPGPGETILDRAFQLKYIPGSDQQAPGGEHLSSLARFEALMREVDAQREDRTQSFRPVSMAQQSELRSAWDVDDSSNDDDSDADSDDTQGESLERDLEDRLSGFERISRRATGLTRDEPSTPFQLPRRIRGTFSPGAVHQGSLSSLATRSRGHDARCEYNSTQSSIVPDGAAYSDELLDNLNASSAYRTSTLAEGQHGHSATSSIGERLSMNDYNRRHSSTSSMLIMQSNAHTDTADIPSPSAKPRAPPPMYASSRRDVQEPADKYKSWRSSTTIIANDRNFL
ncbi:hypothetical protein BD289DRAFT_452923 [Coniella lustricola]|uniref:PH domain-containing protein n=1 Tax=Coniella lustricola TaxID=2025994 RepID=A0A2T3A960_9PEZI|nr:hypothetical protein BD289DRAFT_452923 [Coniella lustricola]